MPLIQSNARLHYSSHRQVIVNFGVCRNLYGYRELGTHVCFLHAVQVIKDPGSEFAQQRILNHVTCLRAQDHHDKVPAQSIKTTRSLRKGSKRADPCAKAESVPNPKAPPRGARSLLNSPRIVRQMVTPQAATLTIVTLQRGGLQRGQASDSGNGGRVSRDLRRG